MKTRNLTCLLIFVFVAFLSSCNSSPKSNEKSEKGEKALEELELEDVAENNTLTQKETQDGWMLMFDGKTSDGWRGYKKDHFPAGWGVVD